MSKRKRVDINLPCDIFENVENIQIICERLSCAYLQFLKLNRQILSASNGLGTIYEPNYLMKLFQNDDATSRC